MYIHYLIYVPKLLATRLKGIMDRIMNQSKVEHMNNYNLLKNDILKYCDCIIPIFNMLNRCKDAEVYTQFINKYDELSDIIGLVSRTSLHSNIKISEKVQAEIHHILEHLDQISDNIIDIRRLACKHRMDCEDIANEKQRCFCIEDVRENIKVSIDLLEDVRKICM